MHSRHSRMQGTAPIEGLLERAAALGMSHLALTEVNGLWGFIHFTRLARRASIQAICGSHIQTGEPGSRPLQDLVLLVASQTGYENLCRLLSGLHDDGSLDVVTALKEWGDGLLALCPDPALLGRLATVVPAGDLFGELRPGADTTPLLAACRELGVAAVSTGEVYFLEPGDAPLYDVLRAIDRNERLSDLPPWEPKGAGHYFADEAELRRRYPHCPEAVDRTVEIAARCKTDWDFSATIFPGAPPGEDPQARLREQVYSGAARRYGTPLPAPVQARLEKELRLVGEKDFATYFLTVADIVGQTHLTIGRGSGAASIISYCLLITQVDPLRHNLAFERFLNPERTDMPDLDVDFAWDERDAILDYVFRTYGTHRAAMVANQVTLQPRSAVREVAKVYGLSNEEILTITKRIGLVFAEAGHPAPRTAPIRPGDGGGARQAAGAPVLDIDNSWEEIISLALRLIGVFHYPSVHAGGVVVVPDEIRKYVPVLTAPKGVPIVEWEKDQVEDSGLVKIDLLGNRSLAVVRDGLQAVNLHRQPGERLRYHDIRPLDDPGTRELMERGRTMGVFYIESPATRQLLAKAGKADYEHVVIYSSIIRPAANRFSNLLIERIRGAPWQALHPDLAFMDESYGIMVYQEQVAQSARALADFSWAEADMLQKIGTKKSLRPLIPELKEKFISRSLARDYPREVVQQLWEMIESFQGYSFTKAHSASYARLSLVCAYLKTHYPAEFLAAVISNRGGYYS
ncbi:MAG: PHP domain-containing protein, partial [Candidatus Neomarinimicrobiota bacterium]